jgi:glucokinase
MTLLAGDLGGTKTLLALCDDHGVPLYTERLSSHSYGGLAEMVEAFLREPAAGAHPRPTRAAFGVAGLVEDVAPEGALGDPAFRPQRARITNLSFTIETAELRARSGLSRVRLYNDFYTVAAAIAAAAAVEGGVHAAALDPLPLNPGARAEPQGTVAVLGAGTGLGQALIARGVAQTLVLPTEGGHTDFAPRDKIELELLAYLLKLHPEHVSVERVLSGPGLATLYEFFAASAAAPENPAVRAELSAAGADAPAVISQHALRGDDPLCELALQRFVMLYGAEAGNLALKCLARGGVYLAGGIAAKILPRMTDGTFLANFVRKGRFETLLRQIPVYLVQNPEIGLLGAGLLAAEL